MEFNDYPNSCPPHDARDTADDEIVFRFLGKNRQEVTLDDLKSYYDMGIVDRDHCQGRGLSIYTNEEGVRQTRRQVKGFKNRFVARGVLVEGMGRLKNTPGQIPNHHTWWVASDAPQEPISLFSFVDDL